MRTGIAKLTRTLMLMVGLTLGVLMMNATPALASNCSYVDAVDYQTGDTETCAICEDSTGCHWHCAEQSGTC